MHRRRAPHAACGMRRATPCRMARLTEYLAELEAQGRYYFTTEEAVAELGEPISRVRAALRKAKTRGEVVDPHRSFHVILPHEHRGMGCLPAEELVPPLMQHLHEPYYVALLSAAEIYGAADDEDVFQVMARMTRKPISCGKSLVQFVGRKDLDQTPLREKSTSAGPLRIASPEATALEMVGYAEQCGGLEHVARVISALGHTLDAERLVEIAPANPIAWSQRLGYLLDVTDNRRLANALVPVVKTLAQDFAPLVRARPKAGANRVARWKLAVNAAV